MTPDRPLTDAEAFAALEWYRAVGVDLAIGEMPVDRFAASRTVPGRAPVLMAAASAALASKAPPRAPDVPAMVANADPSETAALAASARTLDELRAIMDAYDGCVLKKRATQLVFADGNPEAEIMLVGEGPGADEDRIGKPFVGRAGQLLDKMLASIGLDRQKNAYITNVINWRPPDNREPSPEEAAACLPFLRRHIELAQPKVIILLGAVAARHVVGVSDGIMKLRGRWMEYRVGDAMVPLMPTLHPAYLLRQPAHKKLAWRDLQAVRARMADLNLPETD
ncbi:MAG: uracil-DNA glycosylase [Reyranella sp.]